MEFRFAKWLPNTYPDRTMETVNVSGPKIKRTNSYEVEVSVGKAKHGIEVPLDVMY